MKYPKWEDYEELTILWGDMDPVYEETLAQAMRGWPEPADVEGTIMDAEDFDITEAWHPGEFIVNPLLALHHR